MNKKVKTVLIVLLLFFGFNNSVLSQEKVITIKTERNNDRSVNFYYEKNAPGSYYLRIKFSNSENTDASSFKEVVKGKSGFLFKLEPIDPNKPMRYSYKTSYIRGVPNPKVDSLFVYTLPFKKGNSVLIRENNNVGEKYFGNEKPHNWKSYGIGREKAEIVTCMRKGIVVKIVDEYISDSLIEKKFTTKMNSILIEHADGTYASYIGFKKDAIFVKLGQKVYPQTELGILDIFNDSFKLYFQLYYLRTKNLDSKEKNTIKNRKRYYAYITPFFKTTEGNVQLEDRKEYIIAFDDDTLFKEFTKREQKKYKKNPEDFE